MSGKRRAYDGTVCLTQSNRRPSALDLKVAKRRDDIVRVIRGMEPPATVRQVYYQCTIHRVVEKDERGYEVVQMDLALLRKAGVVPYDLISDPSRGMSRPQTFNSVEEALEDAAHYYRKHLWEGVDCQVQIWVEKEGLVGVLGGVSNKYDVPIMAAHGFSSSTLLKQAAQDIEARGVPAFVYHCGDFDPSGVAAADEIEQALRELAPTAAITFERLGVWPAQIGALNLVTRPTKMSDSRAKDFGPISCEIDSMRPADLRALVENAILRHMPAEVFGALMAVQAAERRLIRRMVASLKQ